MGIRILRPGSFWISVSASSLEKDDWRVFRPGVILSAVWLPLLREEWIERSYETGGFSPLV